MLQQDTNRTNLEVNASATNFTTAGRDIFNIHPKNVENQDKQTAVFELRCFGLKITGLNPWAATALGGVSIGATYFFGLSLIEKLATAVGALVVHASCGSLDLLVYTKDNESKQMLIENLLSKTLLAEIEAIVGGKGKEKIEVKLTRVGAVIVTAEELANLEKHMKAKQKAVQWKIENDCRGSMLDFCCTLPIFQNKSRIIIQDVLPNDETDYLECIKHNLELDHAESADTKSFQLRKIGFLAKHSNYRHFVTTLEHHPSLQRKVNAILKSLAEDQTISTRLCTISDLLAIDPKLFPGDCEWVLRNLTKVVKSFVFAKEFNVAKDLLVWMIRLLPNVVNDRKKSWFLFLLKVSLWFICFDRLLHNNFSKKFLEEFLANTSEQVLSDMTRMVFRLAIARSYFLSLLFSEFYDLVEYLLKENTKVALNLITFLAQEKIKRDYFSCWVPVKWIVSRFLNIFHLSITKSRYKQLISLTKLLIHYIRNLSSFRDSFRNRYKLKFFLKDLMILSKMMTFYCIKKKDVELTSTLFKLLRLLSEECMLPLVNDKQLSELLLFSNKRFSQLSDGNCDIEKFYLNAVKLVTGNKEKNKKTIITFKTYHRGSLERSVANEEALLIFAIKAQKLQVGPALVSGENQSTSDSGYASSYVFKDFGFTSSYSPSYVSKDTIAGISSIADVDDLRDSDFQ